MARLPTGALLAVVPAALLLVESQALAQPSVNCEVRSILGRQAKGGVDPKLSMLKRQLKRPPFSAFKSFKPLGTKQLVISQRKLGQARLPNKKLLRLTFKERLLGAKKSVRLRMHLSIMPPRAVGFLPGTLFTISDGGTLLVAGDRHGDGTLIVGITCRSK